jgi:predicted  nucleic acid-binding Zn-ribbon protein
MHQTWHHLNYVVNYTRERLPLVEEDIKELQEKLKTIKEKIEGAQQEYEKEHDSLTKKISACEVRLGDIRKKRKGYE